MPGDLRRPLSPAAAPRWRAGAAAPRWRSGAAAVALLLSGLSAHAGLFDDDEARKAILDIRTRIQTNDDAARARLGELQQANTQLLDQVQQLRRALFEINNQLEQQRTENAALRGNQEQLARDVAELQRQFKDSAAAMDERLRGVEPQKVNVDGKEFAVTPDEQRAYEQAITVLRSGDFDKASGALFGFIQRYPSSGYLDSVRFWLGNAQYGQKNYKDAIASFRSMVAAAPQSPRAPEALLAVANCQLEMKDPRAARRTLDELLKSYPRSDAANAAKERLATLKG